MGGQEYLDDFEFDLRVVGSSYVQEESYKIRVIFYVLRGGQVGAVVGQGGYCCWQLFRRVAGSGSSRCGGRVSLGCGVVGVCCRLRLVGIGMWQRYQFEFSVFVRVIFGVRRLRVGVVRGRGRLVLGVLFGICSILRR